MPSDRVSGIDIRSRSIELAVLEGGQMIDQAKVPTTFNPLKQCSKILNGIRIKRIVATGHGRKLFADSRKDQTVQKATEIQAYALGGSYLFPEVRTVLDIGGQDTRVILINETGKMAKFEMYVRMKDEFVYPSEKMI